MPSHQVASSASLWLSSLSSSEHCESPPPLPPSAHTVRAAITAPPEGAGGALAQAMISDTAIGYSAVRSGVHSGPHKQNHARLHLACINLFIFYGICLKRPSGNRAGWGASAGAGAGRAYRVAPGRGRSGE
eukprot:1622656-Pleurochrysis_carterae.AAC.1